jgi:hypothetical protein
VSHDPGTCPDCKSAPPDPFNVAVDHLLDVIEGTELDEALDPHAIRAASYAVEGTLPEEIDGLSLREARLIGALCRLAGELTLRPTLVRTK